MGEKALGSRVVCQVGVIVRDIEAVSRAWAAILGVEPPAVRLTDAPDIAHTRYYGKPTGARAKLAFFQLGQVSLELIEPVGGPSTWQEFLEAHGQGLHHIAFHIQGMDAVISRLEAYDINPVQRGDYPGGRYAYLDGCEKLGAIVELLENLA